MQAFTLAFLPSFDFSDFERFLVILLAFGDFVGICCVLKDFGIVFDGLRTILQVFDAFLMIFAWF